MQKSTPKIPLLFFKYIINVRQKQTFWSKIKVLDEKVTKVGTKWSKI